MDRGAWRAAAHGVTKSRTQLCNSSHTCARTHTHTHKVDSQENPAREVSLSCLTGDGEAGGAGCSPSDPLSHRWKAGGS